MFWILIYEYGLILFPNTMVKNLHNFIHSKPLKQKMHTSAAANIRKIRIKNIQNTY